MYKSSIIVSILALCFCALDLTAGSMLKLRQESEAPSSVSAPVSQSATATEELETAAPSSEGHELPTLTATTEDVAAASSTPVANGTESASNTTSSLNSTTTPSLNATNDPNKCHVTSGKDGVEGDNPFCDPQEGEIVFINETYNVIWDPTHFPKGSNATVVLKYSLGDDGPNNIPDDGLELNATTVSTAVGSVSFALESSWLKNDTATNLTLWMYTTMDGGGQETISGPTFTLDSKLNPEHNNTSSQDGSSNSKAVGEKVGIPIGSIAFIVIVGLLAFFLWRYMRKNKNNAGGKGDYLTRRSHSERTAGAGAGAGMTGGHRRTESFHDEPTRGMELQDRNGGGSAGDNWEWGRDSVGSPTSPGGSNVFRDEIQRQKTGGSRP